MGKARAGAGRRRGSRSRRPGRTRAASARTRWLRGLLAAVIIVGVARGAIFDGYRMGAVSMEDSLRQGDLLLVERLSFGNGWLPRIGRPQAGDVVVFHPPGGGGVMIKRCVAVAGQRVQVKGKILYVDGERAADPPRSKYVEAGIQPAHRGPRDHFGPLTVPAGHIFVLGDNRDRSRDSRFFGPLSESLLVGRVVAVLWPAAAKEGGSRWSRLLAGVD